MQILYSVRDFYDRNREILLRVGAIAGLVVIVPLSIIVLTPAILGVFAPRVDLSKDLYSVNRPIAFTFLDAGGQEVGHRGAIVGARLKLEEMPSYLPDAFIAMEDRSFYKNTGIDMRGLMRATISNMRAGHVVAGGSTITQQTAKIIFTGQERTLARKIQELFDTAALNKSLSKKEILELYLNRIYLGSGAYGVDGAARTYFGKSARNVTLAEAAMLATLTSAPSVFSPRRDLARAQERANHVLHAMVEIGAITKEQAAEARAHPATVSSRIAVDARNFYFDAAADEARRVATINGEPPNADLIVHTNFEPKIQDAARYAVAKKLGTWGHKLHIGEAAVVVMKTDGAVTALLGGRDYDESTFNRAMQAHRQPGSAFKPFVYLAAIENGLSPWDVRDDGPVDIDGWTPTNYGGRSYGTVTLSEALAHSINTVTAGLAQEVGITNVVEAAQRLGITSPLEANASLALGTSEVTPFELTSAYAAFASGGLKVTPYFVTEVDDTGGHILYKRVAPQPQRVIAEHVDRDMLAMLANVVAVGTGRAAAIPGHETAGKTGTTQDYHDAWFVGFTADYVAGVWLGNDDSAPMKNVTGGSVPASIWNSVMTVAEEGLPNTPLQKSTPQTPSDIANGAVMANGDDETGGAVVSGGTDETNSGTEQQQQTGQNNGSFWGWLFGHGNPNGAAPSSRASQSAVPQRVEPPARAESPTRAEPPEPSGQVYQSQPSEPYNEPRSEPRDAPSRDSYPPDNYPRDPSEEDGPPDPNEDDNGDNR
ncbi:MAG TPA: PBP1A family penicillin-binding protein [Rhizomicrobium sp.]|nr:PBP1A family penicillin-binding protein [Rhizomicrobium sp.]